MQVDLVSSWITSESNNLTKYNQKHIISSNNFAKSKELLFRIPNLNLNIKWWYTFSHPSIKIML